MVWQQLLTADGQLLYRMAVRGGWLVKTVDDVMSQIQADHIPFHERSGYEWRSSVTFMPDTDHEWDPSVDYIYKSKERRARKKELGDLLDQHIKDNSG